MQSGESLEYCKQSSMSGSGQSSEDQNTYKNEDSKC